MAETVVVTGASGGLGRAIAREFGKHGAQVVLIARGEAGLRGAAAEVEAAGGKALIVPADVADAEAVEAVAERAERHFGPIDIWVNNAMASVFSPVKEMTAQDYSRATAVTYLGFVHGTLSALHRMLPRDRGTIVQVGSALAYRSIPLQSAYCAAKHAMLGFTASLRCELIHDKSKVHVSMVHMPAMNTTQFGWVKSRLAYKAQPVPPIFEPEVCARAVYWAAHHKRREVYVGMSTVKAIVGNKIAAAVLDEYLGKTGYEAQQTLEREEPGRPNNLDAPVDAERDCGTHGRFGNRSSSRSAEVWLSLNRTPLVGFGMIGLLGAGLLFASKLCRGRWA